MNRFEKAFEKKAFAAYLTAGDGSFEHFFALLKGGVNLLEIGIPYSDPVADGPVIQKAMERALKKKTGLEDVFILVKNLRKETEAPLVLFTYYNPIQARLAQFLKDAKAAGADGILVVDLPLEEAGDYSRLCKENGLEPIFVAAPTTPMERIERLARAGGGFLYYACRKGTTGEKRGLPAGLAERLRAVRESISLPILAGFGISTKEDATAILKEADGLVVGSHFVRAVGQGASAEELERMAYDLRP